MAKAKKGNRVWVAVNNWVEKGTVTSVSDDGYRVRWGEGAWGGISTFRSWEIFLSEPEACIHLAAHLQNKADALLRRSRGEPVSAVAAAAKKKN